MIVKSTSCFLIQKNDYIGIIFQSCIFIAIAIALR
jgi:hypothetical protein